MRHSIPITLIVALVSLGLSCSDSDDERDPTGSTAITGSNVMAVESRTVATFDEVTLSAVGDVSITIGTPQSGTVTVDDNIMPYLQTVLSGSRLKIRIQAGITATDYDLTVGNVVAAIEALTLAGVGNLTVQGQVQTGHIDLTLAGVGNIVLDSETDRLNSLLAGVGNFVLTGSTQHHACVIGGSGDLSAFGLTADTCQVTIAGEGNAQVHAADHLDVVIAGIGTVYYHGQPTLVTTITGTGSVVDAN